jgi:hypothetical protein
MIQLGLKVVGRSRQQQQARNPPLSFAPERAAAAIEMATQFVDCIRGVLTPPVS